MGDYRWLGRADNREDHRVERAIKMDAEEMWQGGGSEVRLWYERDIDLRGELQASEWSERQ